VVAIEVPQLEEIPQEMSGRPIAPSQDPSVLR
jgi:hypothetical protein